MNFELVQPEIENVRAALDWAAEADAELGVRLVVALVHYWVPNAPEEAKRRLQSLLEREPDMAPALKASAIRALGGMTYILGDFAEGTRLHEASLEAFRALGDEEQAGMTLVRLSIEAQRSGDNARASELAEEALEICRRYGNRRGEAEALYALADVAFAEGRSDEALRMMERSSVLAGEVGFLWWQVGALEHLAEYALLLGRSDDARAYIADGLTLARSISDRQSTVWFLALAAWLAALDGTAERAGLMWGAIEADEKRGRIGQWELQSADYRAKLDGVRGNDFESGRSEGQRLTLNEATSAALAGL
jgi:tetratricopeptide (TPR) repeat protein